MQKRILYILSLGHLVTDINQGVLPIFLAVYKEQFGLSYMIASLIVALSNLSSSVIQPLFGHWSDRRQIRWLLPGGCLLAGLGMAAIGLVPNYFFLLVVVFISGLGVAAFHPEAAKSAHYISGPLQASSMAIFSVGGNLGFGLGPIIASLIITIGGLRASWLLLVPTVITVLFLAQTLPAIGRAVNIPRRAAVTESPLAKTSHRPAVALTILILVVVMRSWLHMGLVTYISFYYINYLKFNEAFASAMLTVFLVAGAMGTLAGGKIADYWGTKKIITASLLLLGPLVFLFPSTQGLWSALLLAIIGFVLVSSFAPAVVMAQALMPQHVGMASGLMMGFAMGAGGLGVFLLGGIADARGILFVFQLLAIIPALAAGLALLLPDLRQTPAILVKEK